MLQFIINVAISVWMTSTIFMLYFYFRFVIHYFRKTGEIVVMPLGAWIFYHFCPIIHTIKCFENMKIFSNK